MSENETRDQLLGRLLRERRTQVGITQAEMAEALSVDQPWVSRHESGELKFDFLEVVDYLEVIGMPISKFSKAFERELQNLQD